MLATRVTLVPGLLRVQSIGQGITGARNRVRVLSVVLLVEHGALCMLGKRSATELHPLHPILSLRA